MAVHVTGTAQQSAWSAGTLPPIEEVRAGTWSVPVPIPENPLRYTLTYVLESGSRLVVVDPGWDSDAGWRALCDGLTSLGAAVADVSGVVVTHAHADHLGLAGRIRDRSDAWVAMHPAETAIIPSRFWDPASGEADDVEWLGAAGVPAAELGPLRLTVGGMAHFLTLVTPDLLLEDGDLVPLPGRTVRAIWTPGHTPGHLCFHDEVDDLLLTGDHVLPRISPNIGAEHYDDAPPLAQYLDSLTALAAFDTAEALPAHEYRFRGLADRVRILLRHHEDRCAEITRILDARGPSTAWQVATHLTWSRTWPEVSGLMRRAAVAEASAHLQYLTDSGAVHQVQQVPRTYANAPERFISTSNSSNPNPAGPAS